MEAKPHIELPTKHELFDDLKFDAEELSKKHNMPVQFFYEKFRYTVESV